MKRIVIKLSTIEYTGRNIGNQLEFRFKNQHQTRIIPLRLINGNKAKLDQQLFELLIPNEIQTLTLEAIVTEVDNAKNDIGTAKWDIQLNELNQKQKVSVFEDGKIVAGKAAVFTFDLQAITTSFDANNPISALKLQQNEKLLVIIGDLNIGGDECDTFETEDENNLMAFLDELDAIPNPKQLVLLGDVLELWETDPLEGENIDNELFEIRKQKLANILSRHPKIFSRLKQFEDSGNEINFVIGAHDNALNDIALQQELINASSISFIFSTTFYHPNLALIAAHGSSVNAEYFHNKIINRSSGQLDSENFSIVQKTFKSLNGKNILNFDTMELKDYFTYINDLIFTTPQVIVSQEEKQLLSDFVDQFDFGETVDQAVRNQLKAQAVFNEETHEPTQAKISALGLKHFTSPISETDLVQQMNDSQVSFGETNCSVLSESLKHQIILKDRQALVQTGSWRLKYTSNPSNPGSPIKQNHYPVTLIGKTQNKTAQIIQYNLLSPSTASLAIFSV